jgi:hypothetical protein
MTFYIVGWRLAASNGFSRVDFILYPGDGSRPTFQNFVLNETMGNTQCLCQFIKHRYYDKLLLLFWISYYVLLSQGWCVFS